MRLTRILSAAALSAAMVTMTHGAAAAAPAPDARDAAAVASEASVAAERADAAAGIDSSAKVAKDSRSAIVAAVRSTKSVDIQVGAQKIELSLPNVGARKVATAGDADVIVGKGPVDVVVERTSENVRAMTVINDASAPTAYEYKLTGAAFRETAAGDVEVVNAKGELLGAVKPAWALDANGAPVPTRYEVSEGRLIQHVDHRNSTHPVVADPDVSFGWYIYVRWSKKEVKDGVPYLIGGAAGFTKYACDKVPTTRGLRAICVGVLATYFASIHGNWQYAASNNRCVLWRFDYDGPLVGWESYAC